MTIDSFRRTLVPTLVASALLLAVQPARAMVPVIDIAAVTQLLMQLNAWTEQLRGMEQQVSQLRDTYGSITGVRGMEQLLPISAGARNYLPTDWASLSATLAGAASVYPALAASARAQAQSNAVLTPAQLAQFPPALQTLLTADRQAVAGGQALTRLAYSQSSDRFAGLATFIQSIGATGDSKAIAELQGRIQAEQAMLANEGVKLASLAQVAAAETAARDLVRREQVVANHGQFATRFQPVPPAP